jgi:hypothetical protein
VRKKYQSKERKSIHKFEIVRGQELLVQVPLSMADVWAEMQARIEELAGQAGLQILRAILENVKRLVLQVATIRSDFPQGHAGGRTGRSGRPDCAVAQVIGRFVADVNYKLDLAKVETKLKDDPGITMLVNNSGFASVAPLLDADIQKMEDMIALNVTALTRLRVRNASALCF